MMVGAGTLEYILREFGVESLREILRDTANDGFTFDIRLPLITERVDLNVRTLRFVPDVFDVMANARDRLFRNVLACMAKHDIDIKAILNRQQQIAKKRAQLVAIIEGMSAPEVNS